MRVVRKELVMCSIDRLHMQWSRVRCHRRRHGRVRVAMWETVFVDIVNCKGKGTSRVLYEPEDEPVKRYN